MSTALHASRTAGGNLSQQAYDRILLAILAGDLPLGSAISRRNLSEQLGMSLQPVAEALQRLETDGLVESRPRSGTRVVMPTTEDVRGHYVVREALESQAARLFAEKASQRERIELQKMAKKLDQMFADPARNVQASFDAHQRLHYRIAECTGCPALVGSIVKNHVLVLNWLYNSVAHNVELPANWHNNLVRILVKGDVEAADRAMREHVRFGLEHVLSCLSNRNLLVSTNANKPALKSVQGESRRS